MKNQLLIVSLIFGLIFGLINILFGLINYIDNLSYWNSVIIEGLFWVLLSFFLFMAHYVFSKYNSDFISFKDAILIGLIIIGISFIISTLFAILNYRIMLHDRMQQYFTNMNDEEVNKIINFSDSLFFTSLLIQLITQVIFLFVIITIESQWKIYKKAGKKGWASIIPVYNTIVLLEIVKKPVWWIILLIIPFINLIFVIWITNLLSKRFGKDTGFTVGLIFLPFIFFPLLGMSKAEYINY